MPYIDRIEFRGFKSFGNSKVSLPLSKGLTAIVGPNGMGKSNIVDALCFVLGWMSAKIMRAERFSDLLFKGGNGHRPAPFAEVSLHFNNEDGALPVNSQTVVISRRVDRSGKCVYRINKKRVSRQEIIDLLAASMTSPGGHNFVMQGDVDRFIKMSPIDRRLIIDDLAGVAEYEEKKQKSMGELQKVEENLDNARMILREISGLIENLKAQMETAIRYKQLKRDLEQTRGTLLWIRKEKYEKKISQLKRRTDDLSKEVRDLREKRRAIVDRIDGYEEKIKHLEDLIDEKQSSEILKEAEAARTQISILYELLRSTAKKQSKIDQEIAELTEDIKKMGWSTIPNKFTSLSSKFGVLHEKFNVLSKYFVQSKSSDATRNILQKLMAVLKDLALVIDELSKCIDQLARLPLEPYQGPASTDLRDKLIGLQAIRTECNHQLEDLKHGIQEAQSKLERIGTSEKEIRSSIEVIRREKRKLRDEVRGLKNKARGLDDKTTELEGKLQRLLIQKTSLEAELKDMRYELKKIKVQPTPNTDPEALERRARALEEEMESLGEVNFCAFRDLRAAEHRYNSEKLKYEKLSAEKRSLLDFMHDIDEKKKEVFMKTFNEISRNFSEIFSELSPGGTAELILENESIPFEGGIEIEARPEGKEVYVSALSGGEKALTALAFIFALQRYRPTTFYVLDEIDAHLDPKNRKRVAEMLRRLSRESQIVVVTLHDTVMSVADRLFGVTMENKISRLFSVELSGLGG